MDPELMPTSKDKSNLPISKEERKDWLAQELKKRNLSPYKIYKATLEDPNLVTVRRGDLSNWLSGEYGMNSHAFNFFVLWFEKYDLTH